MGWTGTGRMHQGEGHKGRDSHLLSRSFLHIDGEIPPSGTQRKDGGIDMRGAGLVLTYGPGGGRGAEEEDIQQFRAPDQAPEEQNRGQIGKNSEGSDVLGRLLTPFSRKWKRERHLRTTFNSSGSQVNDQA